MTGWCDEVTVTDELLLLSQIWLFSQTSMSQCSLLLLYHSCLPMTVNFLKFQPLKILRFGSNWRLFIEDKGPTVCIPHHPLCQAAAPSSIHSPAARWSLCATPPVAVQVDSTGAIWWRAVCQSPAPVALITHLLMDTSSPCHHATLQLLLSTTWWQT